MEERILTMLPYLNEAQRRLFLANEAISYGRGGISKAERISGVSRITIRKGIAEIRSGKPPSERVRSKGGGRKPVEITHPNIEDEIRRLVDGTIFFFPVVSTYPLDISAAFGQQMPKIATYLLP